MNKNDNNYIPVYYSVCAFGKTESKIRVEFKRYKDAKVFFNDTKRIIDGNLYNCLQLKVYVIDKKFPIMGAVSNSEIIEQFLVK